MTFADNKMGMEFQIMRRVRLVHIMRLWIIPSTIEFLVVGAFVAVLSFFVSFGSVLRNLADVWASGSLFEYILSAIWETEFTVQTLLVAILVVAFYFTWSGARKFRMIKTNRSFLIRA